MLPVWYAKLCRANTFSWFAKIFTGKMKKGAFMFGTLHRGCAFTSEVDF